MAVFDGRKLNSAVLNCLQSHGANPAQSKLVADALSTARDEGLRGRAARKRAQQICEEAKPGIDWKSLFDKLGPILELVLKLIALFGV